MNHHELNKEFRALVQSLPRGASERVERKLIVEFRRRQRRRVWFPAAASAGCVVMCSAITFGLVLWQQKSAPLQRTTPKATTITSANVLPPVTPTAVDLPASPVVMRPVVRRKRPLPNTEIQSDDLAGFIALPSAIGGAPLGSPYIIRAKMTAAQLSFAGLRVMAVDQQQQIDADVLVESDGMIRAIRLRQ